MRGKQAKDVTKENDTVWMRMKKYIHYNKPPYSIEYPYLSDYFDKGICGRRLTVRNNVYVNTINEVYSYIGKPEVTFNGNLELQNDPGFKNMDKMDFRLNEDSIVFKEISGFQELPFKKMGIIKDEYRRKFK